MGAGNDIIMTFLKMWVLALIILNFLLMRNEVFGLLGNSRRFSLLNFTILVATVYLYYYGFTSVRNDYMEKVALFGIILLVKAGNI